MTNIAGKRYRKAEIETLLDALKRQTKRARAKAEDAIQRIGHATYEPYYEYRESLTEIEGVLVLIEDRMENAEKDAAAQLQQYHSQLIVDLLRMKIDVVLRVFPRWRMPKSCRSARRKSSWPRSGSCTRRWSASTARKSRACWMAMRASG